MPQLMTPAPDIDRAAASAEPEDDEEFETMIRELRQDPRRIRKYFPRIAGSPADKLPRSEVPLVLIPRSEAWTDS
jgi:hypothetical protein